MAVQQQGAVLLTSIQLVLNCLVISMILSMLYVAPVALALFLPFSFAITIGPRATICNGFPEVRAYYARCHIGHTLYMQFCARSYGNTTFVGAHDSYAVGVNNGGFARSSRVKPQANSFVVFTNQDYDGRH
jgi:type IV secretory pathway TrbL component